MDRAREEQEVLLLALQATRILLENGAEISRAEDTFDRICRYYGLQSAQAFILSNGIFLTCGDDKETPFARVLHLPVNNTNLSKVTEINRLSRQICNGRFTAAEAAGELDRIESMPGFPKFVQILAAGFSAACFGVIFGGRPGDALCCFITGILLYSFLLYIGEPHMSKIVRYILGSAWTTFLSILFYRLGPGNNLEAMIIGSTMLMIPGVPFINAVRDLAESDYISGSVRLQDAIVIFLCIAIGVGLVLSLFSKLTGGILL